MAYEGLVTLLTTHKDVIAREGARIIIARNLRLYSDLSLDELIERNLVILEIVIQYLRTGNIAEYRNSVKSIIELRRQQGYAPDEVSNRTSILVEKVKETISKELPDPPNEKTRTEYLNRIDGMTALARASTFNTLLKKEDN